MDILYGEVFACSNLRKTIWISCDNIILYCKSDNEQKLVYKQKISIKRYDINSIKLDELDEIDEIIPELCKALCTSYDLFSVELDKINIGEIDSQFKIISGKLELSSKTRWGVNSKGLMRYSFKPLDRSYPKYIVSSKLKPCEMDIYGRIEINEWKNVDAHPYGNFVEKLCDVINVEEYENVIISSKLVFPRNRNNIMRSETKRLKTCEKCISEINEDWTKVIDTYSIDPIGCTDIDDAISIRKDNEVEEYAVHISNPTLWYENMSEIDKLSNNQTTSIYTNRNIYHMIPKILSTDKASLKENEVRNCISVIWSICKSNGSLSTRVVSTSIMNRKNYSYDEFDNEEHSDLYELFNKIWNTKPENSHDLIEKSMISANEYVAKYLCENIKERRNILLRKTVNNGAWYLPYSNSCSNSHDLINGNIYTHFTSPIRRYADQIIHRQLMSLINNDECNSKLDIDTIIRMNVVKTKAKQIESELKWVSIAKPNQNVMLKGTLLYVSELNARIHITEPIDSEINVPIVSNKIYDLVSIKTEKDSYILNLDNYTFTFTPGNVTLNLFWIHTYGLEGLKFEWLDPPISNWLNNNNIIE
tara:strand:+ start:8719 stop:10488 length:1770 start_codon:yes stop_codon:yes gene_type:complete